MSGKRILSALKAAMLVALVGTLAGTASAQDFRGTFRLSHEVRWGDSLLPAGRYTITMENITRPAVIRSASGDTAVLVMTRYVEGSAKDVPTGLIIARRENERFVTALNWPLVDRAFVYEPLPDEGLTRLASAEGTETVRVRLAHR